LSADVRRIASADELVALGRTFATRLRAGDVVYLEGPVGAGKTTFAQAVGAALGVTETMTSPTFVIAHRYATDPPLSHLDLYRLARVDAATLADLEPYLSGDGIALIEWPERAGDLLPAATWRVTLDFTPDGARAVGIVDGD
jgi:tRNA threonylcarbamoyladenosine biosynthesis protein TsaE